MEHLAQLGNYHIIGIAEHWLLEAEIPCYNIDGYDMISWRCRDSDPHGGVLIYIRKGIQAGRYHRLDRLFLECDFEVCGLALTQQSMLVINLYRTPDGDLNSYFDHLDTLLAEAIKNYKNVVIMGDFNISFNRPDEETICLLEIMNSFHLQHTVKEPTRRHNCIDNVFVPKSIDIVGASVIHPALSDHDGIVVIINIPNKCRKDMITYRDYSHRNRVSFLEELSQELWLQVYSCNDAQLNFDYITCTLQNLTTKNFPLVTKTSGRRPFRFGEDLQLARNTLLNLQAIHRRHQTEQTGYQLRQFKKVYRGLLVLARKQANIHELAATNNVSRKTWQIINRECGRVRKGGELQVDPGVLNRHFATIAENIVQGLPTSAASHGDLLRRTPPASCSFYIAPTSPEEVYDIIMNLKVTTSKDFYGLDMRVLRLAAQFVCDPIAYTINLGIEYSVFPDNLKIALITPLHKKGSRSDPINYRPIALLPVLSKVYERVLQKRLLRFLLKYNLLSECQFGFLPDKSTTLATIQAVEYICDSFEQNMVTAAAFLDLSKAFDCIDHQILLSKLQHKGVRGRPLQLFSHYLQNRSQTVAGSCLVSTNYGVPQGSILGPLLFIIFIDDFSAVDDVRKCLYADDTSLYVRGKSAPEAERCINVAIDQARHWFLANRLQLNEDKTSVITFSHHHPLNNSVPVVNFLGFTMDEQLNWKQHVVGLSGKISQNIFAVRKLIEVTNLQTARTAYFALIHSHLSYGTLLWGLSVDAGRIFILQKKVVRLLAGKKGGEHCKPLFKQLRIPTLYAIYILQAMKFIESHHALVTHENIHTYDTRSKQLLVVPYHRVCKSRTGSNYWAYKIFNKIPAHLHATLATNTLLRRLRQFLVDLAPYSLSEFLEADLGAL